MDCPFKITGEDIRYDALAKVNLPDPALADIIFGMHPFDSARKLSPIERVLFQYWWKLPGRWKNRTYLFLLLPLWR